MTAEEIERCRAELAELRRRPANAKRPEIEALALLVGYEFKPKSGGEPRYEKKGRYPLFIPRHRTINKYTLIGILNRLEDDLEREEEEATRGN